MAENRARIGESGEAPLSGRSGLHSWSGCGGSCLIDYETHWLLEGWLFGRDHSISASKL